MISVYILFPSAAFAQEPSTLSTQEIINGIISFKLSESGESSVQDWIDNRLAQEAGSTAEWYIIGLHQSGTEYDFSSYSSALCAYLDEHGEIGEVSLQKYALAFMACGGGQDRIALTADSSLGKQGIMSWVLGLHLLNNGCINSQMTAGDVADKLLELRLEDGGWALTGNVSDVDITAMVLQALAPRFLSGEIEAADIEPALDFLSGIQLEDGGFSSLGIPNPESSAQVITALSSLGIDCRTDNRFIKNGNSVFDGMLQYRLDDGSFSHTKGGKTNHTATFQAFYSLVALERMQNGLSPFFIIDGFIAPGLPVSLPDEPVSSPEGNSSAINLRILLSAAVLFISFIVCLILFFLGRRNSKNFIAILLMALVLVCIIAFTDIRSADDYYSGKAAVKENPIGTVTVSIDCSLISKVSSSPYLPSDGSVLPPTDFKIEKDDTVFSILKDLSQQCKIPVESKAAVVGNEKTVYISAIGNIREFDAGELSGWIYRVNGVIPSVGCGDYILKDGDVVEWLYSLELGNDFREQSR